MTTRRKQTRPQRRGVEDEMLPEVTSLVDKDNTDERKREDRKSPVDDDLASNTSTLSAEVTLERKVEDAVPVAKKARRQSRTGSNEVKTDDVMSRNLSANAHDTANEHLSAAQLTPEKPRAKSVSLARHAQRNSTSGVRRAAAAAARHRRDDSDDGHHVTRLREFVESVRAAVNDATPSSRSIDKTSRSALQTQPFRRFTAAAASTAPTHQCDLSAPQTSSGQLRRDVAVQLSSHRDGILHTSRVDSDDQPLDLSSKDRRQTSASSMSPGLLRGAEDGTHASRSAAPADASTSTLEFLVRRFGESAATTEPTEGVLLSRETTAAVGGLLTSEEHALPSAAAAAAASFVTASSPANLFTRAAAPLMTSPRWRRDVFWSTGRWLPLRSSFGLLRQLPALAATETPTTKTSTAATTGLRSSVVARPTTRLPATELWRKSSKIMNNGLSSGKADRRLHFSSLKLSHLRKPSSHGSHKRRPRLPVHTDVGVSLSSATGGAQSLRQSSCANGTPPTSPTTTATASDAQKQSSTHSLQPLPSDPATRNEAAKHRRPPGMDSTEDKHKDNRKSHADAGNETRTEKKPETEKSLTNGSTAAASKSDTHRRPIVGCLTSLRCGGCGSHFESLFRLTLHLEETGHAPASDVTPAMGVSSSATMTSSSDRKSCASTTATTTTALPQRLVRGQDVWLARGVEQTDRILRCMQCNAAARSLAELTMHMVRTKHYVSIVGPGSACSTVSSAPSQLPHTSSHLRSHVNPAGTLSPKQPEAINRKRRSTDRSCDGKIGPETEVEIRRKRTDEHRSRKQYPSPVGSRSSVTDSMTSSPPSPLSPPVGGQYFHFTPPIDFASTLLTASSTDACRSNNNSDVDKNAESASVQPLPLGGATSRPRASFSMRSLIDEVSVGDAVRRTSSSAFPSFLPTSSYEEKHSASFPVLAGSPPGVAVDMTSDKNGKYVARLTQQLPVEFT